MAKQYYLPDGDVKRVTWLTTFYQQLSLVASIFDITTAELTQLQEDILVFLYALGLLDKAKIVKQQLTEFKNLVRSGDPNGTMAFPTIPTTPTPPAAVAKLGIFKRVPKLVVRIKAHPAYNFSYGEALGIEGPEIDFNPNTYQPKIKVTVTDEGRIIDFTKSHSDGVNIYRRLSGTENWIFLKRDDNPPYLDAETFASHLELEYRVKAILKDKEIGKYSDVVLVVV